MPAFVADGPTGTVTDPIWGSVVTALFVGIAATFVVVALAALIREGVKQWRDANRRNDQILAAGLAEIDQARRRKLLPAASQARWARDHETPIGNQLLSEYIGGPR